MILKDFPEWVWKNLHDHGTTAGGGWQDKSETPGPADQGARLTIEWTTDLVTTAQAR